MRQQIGGRTCADGFGYFNGANQIKRPADRSVADTTGWHANAAPRGAGSSIA
jgi:hypothetical protein